MSELKAYKMVNEMYCTDVRVIPAEVYFKSEADKVLAEKDKEIAELKAKIQLDDDEMAGFLQLEEECGGGDLRNYIAELNAKLAEKDKEIESLKASHYTEIVDAGMENNILKRAIWLTRALRARDIQRWWLQVTCSPRTEIACRKWNNVERKCRAKAEEYK